MYGGAHRLRRHSVVIGVRVPRTERRGGAGSLLVLAQSASGPGGAAPKGCLAGVGADSSTVAAILE